MKNIQKALALVLALVMTFGLSVSAMADWSLEEYEAAAVVKTLTDIPADLTGKTVILHSNDVHGAVESYAYIAALKTELVKRGAEVILVDAGDFSQGTPYVAINKGEDAVTMMNAVGYDVITLGNHEFDFGDEKLVENMSKAEFKVISANTLKNDKALFDPTYVFETKAGLKIGFFGLETPETASKSDSTKFPGVTFLNNTNGKTDLYDCAALQVENLKKDGADLIVGLWHLGVDDESKADGHRSIDILGKTEGVDFVIDGHSHTVMTAGENGEAIQSTGTKFAYVGVIVIDNATKKIEDNCLIATKVTDADGNVTSELAKDETVDAAAQKIIDAVDAKYGAVFATSEITLTGEQQPGNRSQETNNGDLITDAMVWYVTKDGTDTFTVPAENIVSLTNGGGIRAPIKAGDVTMKDINTVLPFGNTITVIYVTGAELLEALEASTFCTPTKIGGYPQTAGIKFTIDTTKEYDQGDLYYKRDGGETTYYAPKTINRVTIESINGKAFDKDATYAVVTNNFVAITCGDTYGAFAKSENYFDTSIPLDSAVMDYIEEELGGVIPAAKYAFSDGEQTQIPAVSNVGGFTDVDASAWYAPALKYVVENKTMGGIGDGTFNITGTVTRGMIMTILARMNGVDTAGGDTWYSKGVAWAVEKGISDGTNPTQELTREQFATMLYRYAKEVEGKDVTEDEVPVFPDSADVSEWAFDAMSWATSFGIVNGSNGKLLPGNPASRVEVAQMLLNYSKLAPAAAETDTAEAA